MSEAGAKFERIMALLSSYLLLIVDGISEGIGWM